MSRDVVVLDAVRSPFGRAGDMFAGLHPPDLLGSVLRSCVNHLGLDSAEVEQVVGVWVEQVGEQAANIDRLAWLSAGLPESVAS